MILLLPREQKSQELPEPVGTVVLVNETMARLDIEAEVEGGILTIKVEGLYLGGTVEAPFDEAKKVWKLG